MHDQIGSAQRHGFGIWLLGGGLCAAVVFCLLAGENRELGLHALGAVFAMNVWGYAILARRVGVGVAILSLWGLAFGAWFPAWIEAVGPVARHWILELGLSDAASVSRLTVPVAIATAGAVTGAMMYLLTRSGRVVLQTGLLSLIVASTPLLRAHEEGAIMAGIIAWHVAVSGSLYRWMMDCVCGGVGLLCAGCGFDLVGLTSPVCPGCGQALVRKQSVATPGRVRVPRVAAKPAGRWY